MSLREYHRKRNFRKTAEPSGSTAKKSAGRQSASDHQFVVQKHDASRLHYDFRLEHDGTLKSWAVPKGPNLDPAVKSLAVQVEDHPLEYSEFEGIIPAGEYGGGTVMVWDHGTWEPEEDADRGLKSGKLKFKLHGEKLKGSWALVRMGGKAGEGGKNWLLIKHRDSAARPNAKSDFLARHPRSVLTNRKMEEIAADADSTWSSQNASTGKAARTKQRTAKKVKAAKKTRAVKKKAAAKKRSRRKSAARRSARFASREVADLLGARAAKLPRTFKPQLATLTDAAPIGDNWLHELKFDGYRILTFVSDGQIRLATRNGKDWTRRFPTLVAALAELPIDTALFDGEVVWLDAEGRYDFQELQNFLRRGDDTQLVYYLFDVPHLASYDLTETPLAERKQLLARLLVADNPANEGPIRYSDHIQGDGEEVLHQACAAHQEGIISKRADSLYQQFRSGSWLKTKCHQRQEFVLGGFTRPTGSRVGFGALLLGYYHDGDLVYAGRVGTGFSNDSLRELAKRLKSHERQTPPFANPPIGADARGVHWVQPTLVGEVEFTEWTDDGLLRHPSFKGLRTDKPAREIVREEPKMAIKTAKRNASKTRRSASASNDTVAGMKITHPERVLYKDVGITKLDLARYYETIADWILPYLANRPLTIVRCPDGQGSECFYQKHWTESLPEAVGSVDVDASAAVDKYVLVNDLTGLVSLVQMGVLEFHPWSARADNLERPDFLVFDLDPGEGVAWSAIVAGAKAMHDRLGDLGLETFVRTTGGKGLHLVAPISRRNTWEEAKSFAKAVADAMVRDAPTHYIATMSKAKRRGKIFVDYLRNQRGATAIASYSSRSRPGATVATPIAWSELTTRLNPKKFTVKSIPARLKKLRVDPWVDFYRVRQSLTANIRAAVE
jgi:bifunctional non-homologous end joining protein LigD